MNKLIFLLYGNAMLLLLWTAFILQDEPQLDAQSTNQNGASTTTSDKLILLQHLALENYCCKL
jgi:hypothetical protein